MCVFSSTPRLVLLLLTLVVAVFMKQSVVLLDDASGRDRLVAEATAVTFSLSQYHSHSKKWQLWEVL